MLPSVLSHELMEGVRAFLRATYPTSTPAFKQAFDAILDGVGRDKMFQGPYLRVGLPFQPGRASKDFFPRLKTDYPSLSPSGTSMDPLDDGETDFNPGGYRHGIW